MKNGVLNPSRVDFVTLLLFCAAAESGSITKAAQLCNIATSAASRRLTEFESAVQTKLLERTSQGISLTPAGHVAMQHAKRLCQGFQHFGRELSDYSSGIRGHVRLWANISALTDFLPTALKSFLTAEPRIHVELEEHLSLDTVRALVDGLADIGVFAEGTASHGLTVFPFRVNRLVVVCPTDHPLARQAETDFASCLEYEFVGSNRGSAILELLLRASETAERPMRLRVQVRSFDAMCRMISAGLGIGILPLATCQTQLAALNLKAVPLTDQWAERRLVVGVRAEGQLSEAARKLLGYLRACAAEAQ
ncbi:LysR family transcriptional regulator [Parapusillimonas sp. SGNA-6]|nr:LysR family transcriptional regulator [Parapusillimonas sp. SGNA-6]